MAIATAPVTQRRSRKAATPAPGPLPRTMWKGVLSFGMLSVPVRMFSAASEQKVEFHKLHTKCNGRIKLRAYCPQDNEADVPNSDLVRAYEYTKDQYVLVTDEEMEGLPSAAPRVVKLEHTVALAEVAPLYYKASYVLEPEEVGIRPYALLRAALATRGMAAHGQVAIRTEVRPALVQAVGDRLVLSTLYYPAEVRNNLQAPPAATVQAIEVDTALLVVDAYRKPFDPARYANTYHTELMGLIEAKAQAEGGLVRAPVAAEAVAATPPADLMAALHASLQAVRSQRRPRAPRKPKAQAATE